MVRSETPARSASSIGFRPGSAMTAARSLSSRASRSARFTRLASLGDLFPRGGVSLERVGFGLLLVPHLLVEPAGDHLVSHRLGYAELGERLHLVRHHLVAGRLDGGEHLFDRGRLLDHANTDSTGEF